MFGKSAIIKRRLLYTGIGILFVGMESCIIFHYNRPPEYALDIVCGRRTDKSEAFECRYNGNRYYFDSYNCKQIFKTNPQKFIDNTCVEIK
jgi:YHS domain-containing protein